jgi:Holliday junction resolvasome RuvABC endonuclease subunit
MALEIRLRRVGFAVFEGPNRLLDWGIRRWVRGVDPVLATVRRISPLLTLYAPSVVVLKRLNSSRKARQRKRVITAVGLQLMPHSVEVHMIKRAEVRLAFRLSGSHNKYQIAATIAEVFPELRRKLPPKRKAYQPERYNAIIFDAIALAMAHQSCCGACAAHAKGEFS